MKKLLFIMGIISLLLSCSVEYYSVSIINNSSKTATYDYNGVSYTTLDPSETKDYKVKAYTPPPQNIADTNEIASIRMDRKGDTFTFEDVIPLNLNVINTLPVDIIIKADNYIDDNDSMEMTIENGKEKTAIIYTSRPHFTSLTDYPVIIDWNLMEDTVYVILR